jgi:hypothetical protein
LFCFSCGAFWWLNRRTHYRTKAVSCCKPEFSYLPIHPLTVFILPITVYTHTELQISTRKAKHLTIELASFISFATIQQRTTEVKNLPAPFKVFQNIQVFEKKLRKCLLLQSSWVDKRLSWCKNTASCRQNTIRLNGSVNKKPGSFMQFISVRKRREPHSREKVFLVFSLSPQLKAVNKHSVF